jgi:hypothetical protein
LRKRVFDEAVIIKLDMCYNCGCFNPEDDMGHPDNITDKTLTHLSEHWGKSLKETQKILLTLIEQNDSKLESDHHLKEMFERAAKAWGQSLDEAKKNTYKLLKSELNRE